MYGTAFGAAMENFRPSSISCCRLFLNAASLSGPDRPVPFYSWQPDVTADGDYRRLRLGMRLGSEHAMLVHNMIAQVPGIKVCMPSTPTTPRA